MESLASILGGLLGDLDIASLLSSLLSGSAEQQQQGGGQV